jgi:RNA polymerase sigma-70 factor, ECF subfamily
MSAALLKSLRSSAGDDAIRCLYRTYGPELYGFAAHALGDRGLAEEVVQEVFTRIWRHADSFDPDKASFRTWLYGIARNAIIDTRRRQSVRPQLSARETGEEQASFDEPLDAALLRWQLQAALERLTPEHRQVIRLAHFQGLTLREISERTGIPLGTIKSRTSYALRGLRLALEEMGVEP